MVHSLWKSDYERCVAVDLKQNKSVSLMKNNYAEMLKNLCWSLLSDREIFAPELSESEISRRFIDGSKFLPKVALRFL